MVFEEENVPWLSGTLRHSDLLGRTIPESRNHTSHILCPFGPPPRSQDRVTGRNEVHRLGVVAVVNYGQLFVAKYHVSRVPSK